MIVTRDNVYWSRNHENHTKILEEVNLKETGLAGKIEIVRIEITPPDKDFTKSLDQWVFKTDPNGDALPDWYDAEKAEATVRGNLPAWLAAKVVLPGQEIGKHESGEIVACYGKIKSVYDSATIKDVRGSATIESVGDSATIESVYGSATIKSVYDSATIKSVYGSATIEYVGGSVTIESVGGSATIITYGKIPIPKEKSVIIDRSGEFPVIYTSKNLPVAGTNK